MTKAIKSGLIVLIAFITMTSCSNEGSPKKVAEKFLTALNARKWDEAKKYSTESFGKFLDMLKSFSAQDSSQVKPVKFEIKDEKIAADGKTATVGFKTEDDPSPKTLDLTKIDGVWKVDIKLPDNTHAMDQPAAGDSTAAPAPSPADTTVHK